MQARLKRHMVKSRCLQAATRDGASWPVESVLCWCCAGSSAAAQRQAYLPSLSPGSTISQASFSGYAASIPGQQPAASWGMLPMHSSAQSIWSSTPADRCPRASAPSSERQDSARLCPALSGTLALSDHQLEIKQSNVLIMCLFTGNHVDPFACQTRG